MKIKIVKNNPFKLPEYETKGSAGVDLQANVESPVVLKPMERYLVPTGLFIEIPEGYEAQVRARSGLAIKHGISLVNGIGTIDSDYRGNKGYFNKSWRKRLHHQFRRQNCSDGIYQT